MQSFVYHAVVFFVRKGGDIQDNITKYLKQIVCINQRPKELFCNQCIYCQKINANTYYDLVHLDAKDDDFSKEKIIAVQNQFILSGLEACQKKICLIDNFDLANVQVFNSLLNFIENTNENNYFIFIAKNIDVIPKTILSRCQVLDILINQEKWSQFANEFNLNIDDIEIIKSIYWTYDEAYNLVKNGSYSQLKQVCEKILHSDNLANLYDSLEAFKKMTYDDIKKVIIFIMSQNNLSDKHDDFAQLIALLEYNPSRVILYDRLIKNLQTIKYE